ncbi:hypothetical protein HYALB_00002042 [Hymenoscyphus albidus]|uniref:Uncharacterized protein n=1 Tax=Hymenoscyphus albidus TaxID=595503 RepID=A0A9N9PQL6_9HELO|nr:hypothetical protein HYALB_00002042 [Hymenoscyphus albidus]
MEALYPDFDPFLDAPESNLTSLEARATLNIRNKDGYLCCPVRGQPGWKAARPDDIAWGISRIKSHDICGVNAHARVRLTCKFRSAIYLCNENPYAIFPKCDYIATYAEDLVENCTYRRSQQICGQEFDSDKYNVVIHTTDCVFREEETYTS